MNLYVKWGRKRNSWHIVRLTRSLEPRTLCGLQATPGSRTTQTFPFGERTCESCLRLDVKRDEGV